MAVTTPSDSVLYPNDISGILVQVPAGPTIDNINYFEQDGKIFKRVFNGPVRAQEIGVLASNSAATNSSRLQAALSSATNIKEIVFDTVVGGAIALTGTITVPAGKTLSFRAGNFFSGTCTISGGIIDAPANIQIFTTDVTLSGVRTCDNVFHAAWYGAVGDDATDNIVALQKCADYICTNTVNVTTLQMGGGIFRISTGLVFCKKNGNEYDPVIFTFRGPNPVQGAITGRETYLRLTTNDSFCVGIQEAKGALVENLGFIGTNALTFDTATGWNPATTYNVGSQRTNRYSPSVGLAIDWTGDNVAAGDQYPGKSAYYTNTSNGGSTTCVFRNLFVSSFYAGIVLSCSGSTQNNEGHHFDHIWMNNLHDGFSTTNSQERTVKCTNFNVWSRVRTVFSNNVYGQREGDPPMIDVLNVAGGIYELFNFNGALGNANISITNVYAEFFYRIGFCAGNNVTFDRCNFSFGNPNNFSLKMPVNVYTSSATKTLFVGCTIIYFGFTRCPLGFAGGFGRIELQNCYLQNQAGINFTDEGSFFFNSPAYHNVSFYAQQGTVRDRNYPNSGWAYRFMGTASANTMSHVEFGQEIVTYGGGSTLTLGDGWKAKQIRRILSPLVRRIPLGNVVVTVSGLTATGTIAGLANVTAYNDMIVYARNFTFTAADGNNYDGAHVMRIASINGSGVISFDRVVEGFVTGTYALYVEMFTTVDQPTICDASGTSLTNVLTERTGAATLTNGAVYFIMGSANHPAIVTASASGTATIHANGSGLTGRMILSNYEYEEYGFTDSDPLTNANFPANTFFTKGAVYKKITGTDSSYGWQCTKSGVKGSALAPEFVELTTAAP